MSSLLAKVALLPGGWAEDVLITTDNEGWITEVKKNEPNKDAQNLGNLVVPAMPNLHSHAFQRAMAGMAEYSSGDKDSFWTWRSAMYDFLQKLGPDELEIIAANLYIDMKRAGYSWVGEFHYLHHQADGTPYEDSALLSHSMIRAAKKAGIGITLMPVMYANSDFGAKEPEEGQARFVNTSDGFLEIICSLYKHYQNDPNVRIGAAFHSLRAVTPEIITDVLKGIKSIDKSMPIHIHVAEQIKEVEACELWSGKRPVSWLLEHADINPNWCLIHATHMNETETNGLAKSGAVAGLCPTTEANLGDGLFNLSDYIHEGGAFGIGSDSQISVNPIEELRWLEYGQRLLKQKRAIAQNETEKHVGSFLYKEALKGGAQALGVKTGRIEAGNRMDCLILDHDHLVFNNRDTSLFLDGFVFAGDPSLIKNTIIGGR